MLLLSCLPRMEFNIFHESNVSEVNNPSFANLRLRTAMYRHSVSCKGILKTYTDFITEEFCVN